MPTDPLFPFTAVVGQRALRRALVLAAIDPRIGAVLIRGCKGTAKSTAIRSLAALLPPVDVVAGCPYNCANSTDQGDCPHCGGDSFRGATEITRTPVRIVELPLGTSAERLLGSPASNANGGHTFQPGLLAAAHQGIVQVDDINLFGDDVVDALLDASATGRNLVERAQLSVQHASRFLLVATMNPAEAELRPGLLDRFGLLAVTEDHPSAEERAEIVRRRVAYEDNPVRFAGRWRDEEAQLRQELADARTVLAKVDVPEPMLAAITNLCASQHVDGARADLAMYRTASAIAAWDQRTQVTIDDIREAALLALPHRQRRDAGGWPGIDPDHVDEALRPFASEAA